MFSTDITYEVVTFSIGDTKSGSKMGKLQLKDPQTGEFLNCSLPILLPDLVSPIEKVTTS